MKIGILTYHRVPNFGAQLQAASLSEAVRALGHEPVVLNYYPEDLESMYSRRVRPTQVDVHEAFARENMNLSVLCRSEEELAQAVRGMGIEGVIFGSDAIFKYVPKRKRFAPSLRRKTLRREVLSVEQLSGNAFWGGWLDGIRAVVVSASSQNCPFKKMGWLERRKMRTALRRFEDISVRDEWTASMVAHIGKITRPQVTPDPLFALDDSSFPTKEEILRRFDLPEHYSLMSFRTGKLKDRKLRRIASMLSRNGMTPFCLPMPEGAREIRGCRTIGLPLKVEDWYCLIKYADAYIGERMHPIIVCLRNAVPFFSFDEYGTVYQSKTMDIVKRFSLENCICSYRSPLPKPRRRDILDSIRSFDRERCRAMASDMSAAFSRRVSEAVRILSHH